MSSNLSPSERETIVIVSDDGAVTVSTNSLSARKDLEARLGLAQVVRDRFWQWNGTTASIATVLPKRRGTGRKLSPEHLAKLHAARDAHFAARRSSG